MIEQQLAAHLRAAVDDEPPLGFDPDEVPVLARRRRRQRQLALSSVGVTVAVIGGIVGTLFAAAPTGQAPAAGPPTLKPEVVTCGDVDTDGGPKIPFPDARRHIERFNEEVPKALEKHIPGRDFEALGEGMLRYGCVPTLMGTYRPTDAEWSVTVRLTHKSERFAPREGPTVEGGRQFWSDRSLVRYSASIATRHDQDGFIAEVRVNEASSDDAKPSEVTADQLADLMGDWDLRF